MNRGRPKEAEKINGSALRDAIIKKYHFIQKAADKIHVSRARLSWCLANNEMKAEHLDEICRLLDHAPAFYSVSGGGILVKDAGANSGRIPKYAENDIYKTIVPKVITLPAHAKG